MWNEGEVSMANTTRWKLDSEVIKFDEIIRKLMDLGTGNKEKKSRSSMYKNFKVDRLGDAGKSLTEDFNDREIKYELIQMTFDKYTDNVIDRTEIKQNILIYEDDGKDYIIIDKNSGAKTFLRLLLDLEKNGAVLQTLNTITSDLIIWLIYKVYSEGFVYEINEKSLILDTIIGFKGDTDDNLSKVEAAGDSVMNILSTLSFLLEANSLNQIAVRLTYGEHKKVELVINVNDTLSIKTEQGYRGKFKKGEYLDISHEQRYALIVLLMYIEILPLIKGWYNESIDDKIEGTELIETDLTKKVWGLEEHKRFLNEVATDLTTKINEKINSL